MTTDTGEQPGADVNKCRIHNIVEDRSLLSRENTDHQIKRMYLRTLHEVAIDICLV